MDKDPTKSEIVKQYYKERTAGTLMIAAGLLLGGLGVYKAIQNQNPTMLCLTGIGLFSAVAGVALRKGARFFGQRAFDQASQDNNVLLPGSDDK